VGLITLNFISFSHPLSHGNLNFTHWDIILKSCVKSGVLNSVNLNTFNYQYLRDTAVLTNHFNNFTLQIQSANVTGLNQTEYLAFWINVYNFFGVYTVFNDPCQRDLFGDCRPLENIKQVGQQQPSIIITVFDMPVLSVGAELSNQFLSLNQVEMKLRTPTIIPSRKIDVRIHACISKGTIGSANLRPFAYTAEDIESQLDNSSYTWLADPTKGSNVVGDTLQLTSVLKLATDDFTNKTSNFGSIQDFVKKYGPNPVVKYLLNNTKPTITYIGYDWSVNGNIAEMCSANRSCFPWWALLCLLLAILIIAIVIAVCVRRRMNSNYYPLN